jgi:hypothetical protein
MRSPYCVCVALPLTSECLDNLSETRYVQYEYVNRSVNTLPRQRINTRHYKNFWARRFVCSLCEVLKESTQLVLPRIV